MAEASGNGDLRYLSARRVRELLDAHGCLPVGLFGGGEDVEIIKGDAFYQSYICHLPRSTIELAATAPASAQACKIASTS